MLAFKEAGGISTTQLGVLFFLQKSPGALLKDVSDALGVNASAITALIGRMEDAGLVRRQPSNDDQRAIHLYATASGLSQSGRGPAGPCTLERSPDRRFQRARDCDGRTFSRLDHRALLKIFASSAPGAADQCCANVARSLRYFFCFRLCMNAFSSGCR